MHVRASSWMTFVDLSLPPFMFKTESHSLSADDSRVGHYDG
jgi:hypothetical protein